jgi:REP element-mobilizing transposase RayT
MPQPIYTAENCPAAYQLDWSLTVFWHTPPGTEDWLVALQEATEPDGVRILNHRFEPDDCSLFLLSSQPHVAPVSIVSSVKGRLQYLVRDRWPKAFQRNYDLRSVGSSKRDKVEAYAASQIKHHAPQDVRLRAMFSDLQIIQPEVDLAQPRFTSHARFWCNLHLVLVHDWRACQTDAAVWQKVREMIRRASDAKGHLLSRVGIVPDHLHMTLGIAINEKPIDVALSYMNNIAYVHGMKPVFMQSCYLGTFGEYDLGAVRSE